MTARETRTYRPTNLTSRRASGRVVFFTITIRNKSDKNREAVLGPHTMWGLRSPTGNDHHPAPAPPHLVREVRSQVAGTKREAHQTLLQAHLLTCAPSQGPPQKPHCRHQSRATALAARTATWLRAPPIRAATASGACLLKGPRLLKNSQARGGRGQLPKMWREE